MQDSKAGKILIKILPFVILIGICVAIAFVFGFLADKQLEDKAKDEQESIQSNQLEEETSSYGVFLNAGPEDIEYLFGYDTVVIDAQYFEADEVAALRDGGITTIYSYLNVGSLEQFRDYYFSYEDITLDTYENWNDEKWVKVDEPKWAELMDDLSEGLIDKGIDGFFIDNCDVYYVYNEDSVFKGLVNILTSIRGKGKPVYINGGDTFVSRCLDEGIEIGDCFDGVNQESVYTCIDWGTSKGSEEAAVTYGLADDEDRSYFTEYLGRVSQAGGKVYVLEYASAEEIKKSAYAYGKERGWTVFVAKNISLDVDSSDTLAAGGSASAAGASASDSSASTSGDSISDNPNSNEGTSDIEEVDPVEAQIEEWLATHTLEEKVAQLFVVTPEVLTADGRAVTQLSDSLTKGILEYPVGGFIFFGRNLKDRDQTIAMLGDIASVYEDNNMPIPFLAVDEEGGLVARIGNNPAFDVASTVPMSEIGATGDANYAYEVGSYIGSYLCELGFNMNMAPDADVLSNPSNTVIGNRSFGSDSELVAEMVIAEAKALDEQGIIFAVKHFPGHGSTAADSHNGYAYTDKTIEELYECELIPFKKAIESGIGVIMVGHISVPNITEDDVPSSLSEYMITNVLRKDLGFEGIVITDAMNMGAVTKQYSPAEAAVLAIQAGADIILMPEDFAAAYNGILEAVSEGDITESRIDASVRRILREKW